MLNKGCSLKTSTKIYCVKYNVRLLRIPLLVYVGITENKGYGLSVYDTK